MKAIFPLLIISLLLSFIKLEETHNLIDLRPKPFSTKPSQTFLLLNLSIADNEVVVSYSDLNNDK